MYHQQRIFMFACNAQSSLEWLDGPFKGLSVCACWKPCPSFVDHMKADARSQLDLARVTQLVASEQADTV